MVFTVAIAAGGDGTAAEPSDSHALHALFEERFLAENVFEVRRQAARLPDDEKFRRLCEWVLPGPAHPGFRLAGDFTPSDPPPTGRATEPAAGPSRRIPTGGELVSPALDLVDVAKATGRLAELAARVAQVRVDADDLDTRRAQVALLLLIRLAGGDGAAASAAFGELFDLFRESDHADVSERWPETLALARGVTHPATRELAGELLHLLYEMYVGDKRGWRSQGTHAWDHWFFATFGRSKHQAAYASTNDFHAPPPLDGWVPVGYTTSMTRGKGLPRPHWQWAGREVGIEKLSGHAKDYLFFRTPLRGEFEVECDLTLGGWRYTELLVAGTWVGPQWNRLAYTVGNAREQEPRRELTPPLADFDEWSRFRAVVRDRTCTFFVNGRAVHSVPLTDDAEPWLAIRSEARCHGGVRDLRITGRPTIPSEIHLAALPDLPGWIPYHSYGVGPNASWRHAGDLSPQGGIVGRQNAELRGSMQESLLRYHRPMLEDGTIEYDFYHEPGAVEVHPALDRLAFLLEPEGVQVHWVTDDKYERTDLDPGNRSVEPEHRRGPARLPLRPADWNRLRLTLRGDTVSLELNGEVVYERPLEPTNQRTFGLFHYADLTEARVRNVVWRGDWPGQLPPVAEQELALPDPDCLDGLDSLKESFTHDFAADGLAAESFEFTGTGIFSVRANGAYFRPMVRETHSAHRVEYRTPIYGDFDATLEFEDLDVTYGSRGAVGLEFNALDDTGVVVACARLHREKGRVSGTAKMSVPLPDGTRRYTATHLADESDRGKLRLVRRGAVVHALIAHGDSPNYRHLGSHRLPGAGTAVRLQPQVVSTANASVEVLLKKFAVRSNSSAIESRVDPRVAALNQYTLGLPGRDRRNLAATGGEGWLTSGEPRVVASEDGLRVRGQDDSQAQATHVTYRRGLQDDFDVATAFDGLRLPASADDELELSVAVAGTAPQAARVSVARTGGGKLQLTARLEPAGRPSQDAPPAVGQVEVESVDGLRIARIQRTLFFLYSENGFYRLLGMQDADPGPVPPGAVRLQLGGKGPGAGEVLLKTFEVRTSKFTD